MISVKNILTISKYEAKVLWRNWFFRIIAILGVGFLTIFNIGVFSEADTPRWYVLSNSWIMPYSAMLVICIPQVAAVIFLATGLIKKDKKIDTNEVFFVRPITNLDYVLGKALALFKLFFLLNLVLVMIPLIVNLTSPFTTFNPAAFLLYPLLMSVPSIVFTTGVAFFLVTILRNQPITIVLLLGIAGVQLIYYFEQFSNIFDFTAFRLSMLVSEISGFVDMEFAIKQRLFYFVTGIGLLFLTAVGLDRLSSHRRTSVFTGVVGGGFLVFATLIMLNLWEIRQEPINARAQMISVNDRWAKVPNVTIKSHHIDLVQQASKISATSILEVSNNTDQVLTEIYFTLNPSLIISDLQINGSSQPFERDLQIVSIDQVSIAPNQKQEIKITYQGSIKESVAHLEVDQERYESALEYFMFSLQKKYAFLQDDYMLLTKEVLWYPDTQISYSSKTITKEREAFINFELDVTTTNGLSPVSQGQRDTIDGRYQFRPEYPLPHISLVIGDYLQKEITVDSITYAIYHYPKTDFFATQLDHISDTLSYLITDIVHEYEDQQKLIYPFKRLQFVEVPLQFTAYNKIYESHQAFLQPETVLLPEKGGDIRQFDFRRQLRDMNRQAREKNQVLTDKEKQANIFNDLIKNVFTNQIGSEWFFDGRNVDNPEYAIFPNYYAYNSGVVSEEWALLNKGITTYLRNESKKQNDYSRNVNGISFTEECNKLMRESSLTEILTESQFNKIQKSVALKSQYLFAYLGQLIGDANLKSFLFEWVNTHQHQLTTYEDLRTAINNNFGLDIDPIIQKVYFDTSQPAFEIIDLQKYEVLDGDRQRYQVLMTVKNSGENDGVLEVKFNSDGAGDPFRRRELNQEATEEEPVLLSVIRKGDTKQLGFVLDQKPSSINLNTIISRNIPSEINLPVGTLAKKEGGILFEGEKVLDEVPTPIQYEVIVDNEDPGFSSFSPIQPTYMRAYLDSRDTSEKKYFGSWHRSYAKWLATTGSDFYGSVIRSAHFTRAGDGEKTTTWTPEFNQDGFYDIYIYMKGKNQNEYLGRNGNNRQYSYHYIINHGDGQDDIRYNISNAEPGWNYLGSYYFNQTGGNVTLTDECDLRTVYADAIKWVKQ